MKLMLVVAVLSLFIVLQNSEAQSSLDVKTKSYVGDKGYSYRFGKEHPFFPSNIQTAYGEFIPPIKFPTAQYCGHCHQAVHAQWRQSAHSNANRAPWYLKNVGLLNAQKGVEFSRHCEGCHDPIAVVSGALTEGGPKKRPYDKDGVTCMVCHSIQKTDTRGTGSFTLGEPAVLLDEEGNPIRRPVSDNEILSHLDRHSKAVMKDFYRTSEYCAACHEAALPKDLNGYKWQRAIALYDEWQSSAFARQSPLPFYKKDTTSTCQTCHMPREKAVGVDYAEKDGTVVSHRWLGANTMVPKYYGFDEQARKVVEFLQNSVFNIDIFGVELNPQPTFNSGAYAVERPLIAPLGATNFELKPGTRVAVSVVIQNKGIAQALFATADRRLHGAPRNPDLVLTLRCELTRVLDLTVDTCYRELGTTREELVSFTPSRFIANARGEETPTQRLGAACSFSGHISALKVPSAVNETGFCLDVFPDSLLVNETVSILDDSGRMSALVQGVIPRPKK